MPAGVENLPHPSRYMLPSLLMEPDPVRHMAELIDTEPPVRLSRPLIAGWLMTSRCQLECRHCCVTRDHTEADPAERAVIAQRLAESGVCRVVLSGGEVTLLPDLTDSVHILKAGGIPVSIYTNGVGIESMAWPRSWDHDLDYVQVSIDGGSPETYEAQRGRGTFRQLEEGLTYLRHKKVRVVAHYVASPWNGSDLRSAAWLAARYGCEAFVAEMYIAAGRAANQGRSVMAAVARDFLRAAEDLLGDETIMTGPMSIHIAMPPVVPFPEWYAGPLRGLDGPLQTRVVYGTTHCFVLPNGDLVPTPAVGDDPTFYSGSLLNRDLLSLWRDGEGFSRFPKARNLRGTLCEGCPDLVPCGGGCDKRALALMGTLDTHDPWCHRSPVDASVKP